MNATAAEALGLLALLLSGCGGVAVDTSGGGGSGAVAEGGSDDGMPPSGLYALSYYPKSDGCRISAVWPKNASTTILSDPRVINIPIDPDPARLLRQDVPWGGLATKFLDCPSTQFSVSITSMTSHSLEVDVIENWTDPKQCTNSKREVPPLACVSEWSESFELTQRCRATVNGVTCT